MRGRKRDGLLDRGVRERRLVRSHDPVQIRSPGPGLAPVADRAHRIAHLRFAERAHGLRLREGIGQLESLVEECLRLAVLRGNRPRKRTQRGRVEGDAPVERGRRSAVVRMLAGRRGGLRASAGKAETCHDGGRRRAREPTPSMPEHCLDDIARRQHRPPTGECGVGGRPFARGAGRWSWTSMPPPGIPGVESAHLRRCVAVARGFGLRVGGPEGPPLRANSVCRRSAGHPPSLSSGVALTCQEQSWIRDAGF